MSTRLAAVVAGSLLTLSACSGSSDHSALEVPSSATPRPSIVATSPTVASSSFHVGKQNPNAVPVGRAGKPRGGVQKPDLHNPTSVASAVAVTVWSWDTSLDYSPEDAARRAVAWMTPELAAKTRTARTSGGDAQWLAVASAHGWTTAAATTPYAPTVTRGKTSTVTLWVTVTPHPGGDQRAAFHSLMVLTLVQAAPTPPKATPAPKPSTSASPSASPKPTPATWQVSSMQFMPSA